MITVLFEQCVEASAPSVVMRSLLERIFAPDKLDALFERTADHHYSWFAHLKMSEPGIKALPCPNPVLARLDLNSSHLVG